MTDDASDEEDDAPFGPDAVDDGRHSVDDVVGLLADERTRHVLSFLESTPDDVVELDDLVDAVVERESGDGTELPEGKRRQIAVALHHNVLPRLGDEALLDYDPRSNTVRYRGDDRVVALLDLFDSTG